MIKNALVFLQSGKTYLDKISKKILNEKKRIPNNGWLAVASFAVLPFAKLFTEIAEKQVKVAIIGVGFRGQNHLDLLLSRTDVDIVAICDIDDRMLASSKETIVKSGNKMPQIFTGDPYAWKKMLEIKGLDAVIISTIYLNNPNKPPESSTPTNTPSCLISTGQRLR